MFLTSAYGLRSVVFCPPVSPPDGSQRVTVIVANDTVLDIVNFTVLLSPVHEIALLLIFNSPESAVIPSEKDFPPFVDTIDFMVRPSGAVNVIV